MRKKYQGKKVLAIWITVLSLLAIDSMVIAEPKLLDISGLEWLENDTFLAVSDAKNPFEKKLRRVSLLNLPDSLSGIKVKSTKTKFPGGLSSDLESVAGIPNTNKVLLVESADNDGNYQRIFLAEVKNKRIEVQKEVGWKSFTNAFNVEGTAVADTGSGLIFIWAERNNNKQFTDIKWTDLQLDPFAIGKSGLINSVRFTLPTNLVDENGSPLYSRSVVGMDVDSAGNLYSVAAFDPEDLVSNPDNGPFRSIIFKIGKIITDKIVLDKEPTILGVVDGFKVESVAIRENGNGVEIFVGTDDENYGGTLRQLPPR